MQPRHFAAEDEIAKHGDVIVGTNGRAAPRQADAGSTTDLCSGMRTSTIRWKLPMIRPEEDEAADECRRRHDLTLPHPVERLRKAGENACPIPKQV